jgi:simple sugar transport system substrate-binding protein
LKVAAIYLAKFNADAYGKIYLNAFKLMKQQYGVDVHLVENVPYTTQLTQATERLLGTEGYDVVIDTNAAAGLFYNACKKYPDKYCIEDYGSGTMPSNTGAYWYDQHAAYYLEGVAAGMLTKNGKVGFINPYKSPVLYPLLNSYALGCQSVRPDCTVRNIYINSFFKPPAEIDATNTLIDGGVDVVNHYQDDQAPLTTAAKRGVWSFGTYLPIKSPPSTYVTSMVLQRSLAKALLTHLRAIAAGTWTQKKYKLVYGTPKPIDAELDKWGPKVPANVRAKVEAIKKKMDSGWSPYKGPIYDAKGKLRVKAGVTLPIRSTFLNYQWNWPVKGVVGG